MALECIPVSERHSTQPGHIRLADALNRLAAAVEALTRHAEMSDAILARCESHLAQEGRWAASAVTALTLAQSIASTPPAQSRRPSRVVRTRVEPPADSLAIGLLCQLSSDLARLAGSDEASTDDVSWRLNTSYLFAPLHDRMSAATHPADCRHTALADCVPMLRWLATANRYAEIVAGHFTADDLLSEYDAARQAESDAAGAS